MNMNFKMATLFEKTREFVRESFKDSEAQMLHFDRTVYWVNVLRPDADEAMFIAAIGHDLERSVRTEEQKPEVKKVSFSNRDHLVYHSEKGAEIMKNFLQNETDDVDLIERVVHLISNHEFGGDEDTNILMDADSLSFLENNVDLFIEKLPVAGCAMIEEKFKWMFSRIHSEEAKAIAKPMYEEGIKRIREAARELGLLK